VEGKHITPPWIEVLDIILIVVIIADWLLFFFIHTENRILYLFSFDSFITYITIAPTGILRFHVIVDPILIEMYYLYFWKVLRLFSVLRLSKMFTRNNSPLIRVYFKMIFTLVIIFFVFGSAQLIFENQYIVSQMKEELKLRLDPSYVHDESAYEDVELYYFWDMIYYMVVTVTTVGYGDIYPHTVEGQYLFILVEIATLSALPY